MLHVVELAFLNRFNFHFAKGLSERLWWNIFPRGWKRSRWIFFAFQGVGNAASDFFSFSKGLEMPAGGIFWLSKGLEAHFFPFFCPSKPLDGQGTGFFESGESLQDSSPCHDTPCIGRWNFARSNLHFPIFCLYLQHESINKKEAEQ
ncbi:hypothetical protein HMPREF9136_0249 [Prevotella dentalis DSM 3688]|uniref:Uncharacterized protein n=1 Tax=Prevotella dentalis (strain ATCC 49559 / DSM 3688 / JCM 13448 / NCTC 12043 / ES 2772) TaxID=908937 RepID=F9D072_PREDD|nr:hypothetical protein HMPREF9136_0249 [Prevotella dentalis DSM 3688]